MWTPATRGRMAGIEKKTKRYQTDLTDEGCPEEHPPSRSPCDKRTPQVINVQCRYKTAVCFYRIRGLSAPTPR